MNPITSMGDGANTQKLRIFAALHGPEEQNLRKQKVMVHNNIAVRVSAHEVVHNEPNDRNNACRSFPQSVFPLSPL